MKKLFLLGFSILSMAAFAQSIDFGVKAGLAYNTDKGVFKTANDAFKTKGKGAAGFQAGAMLRIKAAGFYVQPEALFTSFKNEYKLEGETIDIKKNRLDIPVNVGKTFAMGLAQIQTGPVFSINMKDKADASLADLKDKKTDDISLGWQIGTGVNIKNLNIDLRYEFGLGKTTSKFAESTTGLEFSSEKRVNLLNLSVGYFF